MNKYTGEVRKRSQNLLIVEGNHEKNELFWLLFKCFPEINIDMDDIWIYGTNIYMLYDDIAAEYGADWASAGEDIDLPYVISKKKYPENLRYKEDFTNILIIFDFERHDTNFSKVKIEEMQRIFMDATDIGKLYINYPMIESYQHLKCFPDDDYAERKIPVTLQPGKEYKALVKKETVIGKMVEFPHRVEDLLDGRFGIRDEQARTECSDKILKITTDENMDEAIQNILHDVVEEQALETAKYQLKDWVKKAGYAQMGENYWEHMRKIFIQIIRHNICKANRIQNGTYLYPKHTNLCRQESQKILEIYMCCQYFLQHDASPLFDKYQIRNWYRDVCTKEIEDVNVALDAMQQEYDAVFPDQAYEEAVFKHYPIILRSFDMTSEEVMQDFVLRTIAFAETSFDYMLVLQCDENGAILQHAIKFPKRFFKAIQEALVSGEEITDTSLLTPYPIDVTENMLECFSGDWKIKRQTDNPYVHYLGDIAEELWVYSKLRELLCTEEDREYCICELKKVAEKIAIMKKEIHLHLDEEVADQIDEMCNHVYEGNCFDNIRLNEFVQNLQYIVV